MNFAQEALKRIVISGLLISIVAGVMGWKIAKESAECRALMTSKINKYFYNT